MATNVTENQPILKKKTVIYHIFKHEKYDGAASSL